MSRSMGDRVAHSVGVSCEAEVTELDLKQNDKVIVIASDGVWEFLSNEKIASIVYPYFAKGAPEAAANHVVKLAHKTWQKEEEVIDDITIIVIFLDVKENI